MNQRDRPTRRDFLRGQAVAEALAQRADPTAGLTVPDMTRSPYLASLSRRAMACEFQLFLNANPNGDGTRHGLAALDLVDQLEDQLTVYREHSEVSILNRLAAEAPFRVEANLFELLREGKRIHAETHGAFDYTAGPLSEAWGFARREGAMPSQEAVEQALALVGSQYVELDEYDRTVHFARQGVQINLGGIGKGYALDQAAATLLARGVADFAFHGGNSSVVARGSQADGDAWRVGLVHPLRPERRLGEFRIADRALSTSGSGTQFFHHAGRRYGHIIDPRTGWPAENVISLTVLAPTAAEADALSTALFVLTRTEVEQFCADRGDVSVLAVYPAAAAGGIELALFNLDEACWTPKSVR